MFLEYDEAFFFFKKQLQKRQDAYNYMVYLQSFMPAQIRNWILVQWLHRCPSLHRVPLLNHIFFFPLKNEEREGEDHTNWICMQPATASPPWKAWLWSTALWNRPHGFFTSYFQHMLQGAHVFCCKDCISDLCRFCICKLLLLFIISLTHVP